METTAQIRAYVMKNFYVADPAALADDASLLDQGIVDSTGVLEVVAFLEKTFGFCVADEEMLPENLDSIARLSAFAERRRARPLGA
jgi:acyl carrier protein